MEKNSNKISIPIKLTGDHITDLHNLIDHYEKQIKIINPLYCSKEIIGRYKGYNDIISTLKLIVKDIIND